MENKEFKAESKRLLDLMINSIYTHKEIFLRELISNASDAIDKFYYHAMQEGSSGLNRDDFAIRLDVNKDARTLTITDNGCGMTKEELEENLGTIAKSGSLAFKQENKKDEDIDIIGQFGVGFYSAFMVAKQVTVFTRAAGDEHGWKWQSSGTEGYTIDSCDKEDHGSVIVLELKDNTEEENYDEFLETFRIQQLVKKYSDYIRYPIKMEATHSRIKEGCKDEKGEDVYEDYTSLDTLNSMVPIWKKSKKEVTEEDYENFYREKFFDYQAPIKTIHSSTEGTATYNALLFIPSHAPYNYYTREYEKGLQLYASGVLIMEKCPDLLPDCFSFVRGLVDSQDLSLNISREMLQHDRQLTLIAGRLEKKIKSELLSLLQNDREKYDTFFRSFGLQLKYGVYSDYGVRKDLLGDLLMFYSSSEKKLVTLSEYVSRMKEDQKYIYYACGETPERIDLLPQTELLKEKGYEILYLTDDIDEFCLKTLIKWEDKEFHSVSDGDLGLDSDEDKDALKKETEENQELLTYLGEQLDKKVKEVRLTNRLKSHPVCLSSSGPISLEMEKVFDSMPGSEGKVKADRVLEINMSHPLFGTLKRMYADEATREQVKDFAGLLYGQAQLIEGIPLEDPVAFSNSICKMMEKL